MRKFNLDSSKIPTILLLSAILAAVFFSYYPTLGNGFVFWDDDVHLYENIHVRSLDLEHVRDMFTSTVNKIYIPLTTLSFAIEYHFFKYDPFIYHLDNLLLHLGIVAFVFWLGLRLGLTAIGSGIAALIFGLHPMHVESVAWVTERKDVLYAFLYMAALISYTKYLSFTHSTPSLMIKRRYRYLVLTCFFGILSMLAKPMALSLPLILLLLDWFHERKIGRETVLEKVPLGLAIAGITWLSYAPNARVPGNNAVEAILIWVWTFVFYLRQFLFPAVSVPIYQLPEPIAVTNPGYYLPLLAFGSLILALVLLRKRPWFLFAVMFFFFSVFFLLRFDDAKDATIVADRFMYLPSLGFCYLAGAIWMRFSANRAGQVVGAVAVVLLAGWMFVKTFRQVQVWNNSISLWEHQLNYFPEEPIALNNLAAALREEDVYKEAEEAYRQFSEIQSEGLAVNFTDDRMGQIEKVEYVRGLYEKAIKVSPGFTDSYYNLGNLMMDLGQFPEAVAAYKEALSFDPEYKDAHFSLGELYRKAGDIEQAIYAYSQTVALNPRDGDVYYRVIMAYNEALEDVPGNKAYLKARSKVLGDYVRLLNAGPRTVTAFFNLGYIYGEVGDTARAVAAYQMALDIDPGHGKTLYNLGNVYRDQGRLGEALELYKRVVKLDPGKSDAYLNMGTIYQRRGNTDLARESFQKAVGADPENATAYFDLGFIDEKTGAYKAAEGLYRKAIELEPDNGKAYYNLGNVLARLGKNGEAIEAYKGAVKIDPEYMDALVNLSILSFREKDFDNAVKYCDEAMLLGYIAPQGYLRALEPYRKKKKE